MEFNYLNESVKSYVDRLSEKTPCPGGGSASILSITLANSLVCMVSNYTVASKLVREESRAIAGNVLKDALALKEKLSPLIEKDSYTYEKIRNSYKSVSKDPSRFQHLEDVLKESIELHLNILKNSSKIIEWNQLLIEHCNPNLISDLGVSSSLVLGALKATRINILINLKETRDKNFVKRSLKEMYDISTMIEEKSKKIIEKTEEKIKEERNDR